MSDSPNTRNLPVIPPPCAQSPTRGRSDGESTGNAGFTAISPNPYMTGSPTVTPVSSPYRWQQNAVGAHGSPPTSPTRAHRQIPAWTRLETSASSINFSSLPSLGAHDEFIRDSLISHGQNEFRSTQALGPFASPQAASSAGSQDFADTDCSSFVTIPDGNELGPTNSTLKVSPECARFQKAKLIDYSRSPSVSPTRSEKQSKPSLWPPFEAVHTDESEDDFESDIYANAFSKSCEDYKDPPSTAQPRRHKSKATKEVKLVRGNLILDCPVPTKLYSFLPRRDSDEFVYMRYTACTAMADDFVSSGFTLRPAMFGREVELCICITMYNEDEIAFTRTMHAVMKNISYLCSRRRSRVWGEEAWKKIVVTIVSDGRTKINPRVLDTLAAMGVYQDGIAKNFVNGNEVRAHIFEFTAQVSLGEDLRFRGAEKGIVPVQILFCLKEKNLKKINSHRWLFNALCPVINPNVCILLDVGTRPRNNCIYHLWKAFDQDSNVGGACGEVQALKGKGWLHLLNPLVAAQNFEYKISNILDKPMESVFGYISVLPGALSAYRYAAIQNHFDGTGPLYSYFKGEDLMNQQADIFTSNMYLAEDRILCWELVAKRNESWVLKYVRSAKGDTDVPDSFAEFVSQRRRWLNGALFAACYSQINFRQVWNTSHSYTRKWLLHIEFIYQFFQLLFSFFSLGNFYLTFYFVAGSLSGESADVMPGKAGLYLFLINKYVCIMTLASLFIISLGNRPHGAKKLFMATSAVLSMVYLYAVGCGFYFVISSVTNRKTEIKLGNNVFTNIFVSLISTYGIYFIMSLIYLDPWHVVTSFLQHLLMVPSYVCTLQIFAFCNTHDVTWGTKGDNESKYDLGSAIVNSKAGVDVVEVEIPSEQLDIDSGYDEALENLRHRKQINKALPNLKTVGEDNYRQFRSLVVLTWMTANLTIVLITTQIFDPTDPNNNLYLKIILWSMAIMAAFRALGSLVFLFLSAIRWLVDMRSRTANSLVSTRIKKPW